MNSVCLRIERKISLCFCVNDISEGCKESVHHKFTFLHEAALLISFRHLPTIFHVDPYLNLFLYEQIFVFDV